MLEERVIYTVKLDITGCYLKPQKCGISVDDRVSNPSCGLADCQEHGWRLQRPKTQHKILKSLELFTSQGKEWKRTLLNLGKLSRTAGYIHVKIVPSANHIPYTLTVEHTDADIADAQARQMHKAFVMLRFTKFVSVRNDKICHGQREEGRRWGCFTEWTLQQLLLGAGLCCTEGPNGRCVWIPKANRQCRPSNPCWLFFFHS